MRLYSLEEARAALPEVIRLLQQLTASLAQLQALEQEVFSEHGRAQSNGHSHHDAFAPDPPRPPAQAFRQQIQAALFEFGERGIEVKDPARGLIDFHSERAGEIVYLCFLLGEEDIRSWHTLDGGFSGRQLL